VKLFPAPESNSRHDQNHVLELVDIGRLLLVPSLVPDNLMLMEKLEKSRGQQVAQKNTEEAR
jgi:hypothetical protein